MSTTTKPRTTSPLAVPRLRRMLPPLWLAGLLLSAGCSPADMPQDRTAQTGPADSLGEVRRVTVRPFLLKSPAFGPEAIGVFGMSILGVMPPDDVLARLRPVLVRGNGRRILDGAATANAFDRTDFGSVRAGDGQDPDTGTFTIHNMHSAADVALEVHVPEGFLLVSPPASPLPSYGGTSFQVQLDDTAPPGVKAGTVVIDVYGEEPARFSFAIRGTLLEAL